MLYNFNKGNQKFIIKRLHSYPYKEFMWKLKNLFKPKKTSPITAKRKLLFHEYNIGLQLNHPFIRKTIDYDEKSPCLFLEYLHEYIDLYDFLDLYYKKTSLKDKLQIFIKIVKALEYMHSKCIAHLDIKPENIMIHPITLDIKIIDFGKAFQWKQNGQTIILKNIVTSYGYMAPEEFINDIELYPDKLDIWSLGLVFYCIIYNMFPWDIARDYDNRYHTHATFIKCNMISSSLFYDLHELPKNKQNLLKTIFKKTLHIDPIQRTTTTELLQFLNQLSCYL